MNTFYTTLTQTNPAKQNAIMTVRIVDENNKAQGTMQFVFTKNQLDSLADLFTDLSKSTRRGERARTFKRTLG